jgi:hypothetical protein
MSVLVEPASRPGKGALGKETRTFTDFGDFGGLIP